MHRWLPLFAVLAFGCSETGLADFDGAVGDREAPSLETPTKTDRIVQVIKPKVDVLWVVDNSCSMGEEQAKLAENFGEFIEFFLDSGLDWHIGLVSTDTEDPSQDGKLQDGRTGYKYIDPATPNPVAVFGRMSQLGTGGSYTERGLLAAYKALVQPNRRIQQANQGFYRDDAALHVVTISDEDDQSGQRLSRFEFINFLQNLKDDEDIPVTFSSIVGDTPNGCSGDGGTADPGGIYIGVTNTVGGIFESICEPRWAGVLRDLGLQAAGLKREYFLSEVPVPGTIEVWVVDGDFQFDGVDESKITGNRTIFDVCDEIGGSACFPFVYNVGRNSIEMSGEFVPSPRAEIYIRYELLRGLQPEDDDDLLGGGGGSIGEDTAR